MRKELNKIRNGTILIWLLYICSILFLLSCDITKRAAKQKIAQAEATTQNETHSITTFDFSKLNQSIEDFEFKPTDPLLYMQIITKKGDTFKSANATFSHRKTFTEAQNNTKTETNNAASQSSNSKKDSVIKASEKTESFDSKIILYGFLGLALIIAIIAFLGFKFLNKNNQLLTAVLNYIK